jgi:hypothetical protein
MVYNLVSAGGGGAAKIGETFTLESGLSLNVTAPQKYTTGDTSVLGPGEQAYQVIVAVNNGSDEVVALPDVTISAVVNGSAAEAIYPDGPLTQAVEPGVQMNVPFRFKVKDGTTGALQISVRATSRKPVYFTGTI